MIRKWKSIRIVLYGPAFFVPLIALSLTACGTSLYPDSKGYSYDADEVYASSNQDSKDSTPNGTKDTDKPTKTPSTKAPTSITPKPGSGENGSADDDKSGSANEESETDTEETDIPPPATQPDPASEPKIDGTQLYTKKCAGCHGGLASNNVTNRTSLGIKNAIGRVGVMAAIKLTAEELTAIELAFKN